MDPLNNHREKVRELIIEYLRDKPSNGEIDTEVIIDDK